jgi:hypothetical protein
MIYQADALPWCEQIANATERAKQDTGRKSMAAVATTPAQSEITSKPPSLYLVTRINTPADFPEVARLLRSPRKRNWKQCAIKSKMKIYAEINAAGIHFNNT